MDHITIKEAAEQWKLSPRRLQDLCKSGQIEGATRWGRTWMIPKTAVLPADRRRKNTIPDDGLPHRPMPRKSPFLDMTPLYHTPGTAQQVIDGLKDHPEAQQLMLAQFSFSQGNVDMLYDRIQYFLSAHSGFYSVVGAGMLLALCAMYRGDLQLWSEALQHICEAPCKNEEEREIIALSVAAVGSAVHNTDDYPDWFRVGDFSHLPPDSYPAARVFYIKYLMISAFELAAGNIELDGVNGLGLMRTLPHIILPMIAQAMAEKTVIPEIYLRILCAVAYHNIGNEQAAIEQLDRAIALCIPDRLYGILAEHRRQLDYLLDERLAAAGKEHLRAVRELHKQLRVGWTKLHNTLLNKKVNLHLSTREQEVSRLAVFGYTNQQIADQLHISLASVKQALRLAMDKTGATTRQMLVEFI